MAAYYPEMNVGKDCPDLAKCGGIMREYRRRKAYQAVQELSAVMRILPVRIYVSCESPEVDNSRDSALTLGPDVELPCIGK